MCIRDRYKTIAYELYRQLGDRLPAAVFIPTAYAELLYGCLLYTSRCV